MKNYIILVSLIIFVGQTTIAQAPKKMWAGKSTIHSEKSQVMENVNEAIEPTLNSPAVIDLLDGETLEAWKVPSDRWYLEGGSIIGNTKEEALNKPEWIYTQQAFSDFEFTCEVKLTGDNRRNTGIYYRANPFPFEEKRSKKQYEAPSGYEFDMAYYTPGKKDFRGSLGDWYARPKLRVLSDHEIINQAYRVGDWNRMTIRARANRIEYWLNGIKVLDYLDKDPKASREGLIGFQIHNGSVMKVAYRNIRVLPL